MLTITDTHCHLDGPEFSDDLALVVQRAREAGVERVFVPAIDYPSAERALELSRRYRGYVYPMVGLHPEEVRADWREQLERLKRLHRWYPPFDSPDMPPPGANFIAIGEVGLDFYWSRDFESEQLEAFEAQVQWAVEARLPLMIHCRKAQNEMVNILRRYARELPGGVFHCFTGNATEAQQLLQFDRFVLGVGGVLTFKKSHLPDVLPQTVPLDRIVLETDAPYMAPVPMRGQRNEPAFVVHVLERMAQAYGITTDELARQTQANVRRIFNLTDLQP